MSVRHLGHIALAVALVLSLSGFSFFGLGDDTPKLATLPAVKSQIKIAPLWTSHAVGGNGGEFAIFQPAVNDETLYVSDVTGKVAALARKTGKTQWSVRTGVPLAGGPAIGNGQVFVAGTASALLALDASNGKKQWRVTIPNQLNTMPSYGAGVVIAKNIDDALFAFDANKGELLWKYQEGAPRLLLQGSSTPVIFEGVVLGTFADAKLAILELQTGKLIWQSVVAEPTGLTELTRMVDIDAAPVIADNVIYVASYQGNVSAIVLRDAQLKWTHPLSSYTGVAVSQDHVYVTDTDGYLWAFDKQTGQVVWQQQDLKGHTLTRPAVIGDNVVVADKEGMLHWLSSVDGHFVARQVLSKKGFVAPPVVMDDTVYLQDRDGIITAEKLLS